MSDSNRDMSAKCTAAQPVLSVSITATTATECQPVRTISTSKTSGSIRLVIAPLPPRHMADVGSGNQESESE